MYEKLDLPVPVLCPYCRWKYLLSFWTFGKFRIGKSALSGKRIITTLPESVPFPIYEREEFVSDAWDPLAYGKSYDPSRPFIDQLCELQAKVPHPHQTGIKNVNCDWCDDWWESRECYLSRSGYKNEHLSYAYRVTGSKNSIDLTYCFDMEHSYDCLYCFNGYDLRHSFNCRNCINSSFLYDCRNCTNCFMSWNLRNKQYCILNVQYSKEEYFEKLKTFDLGSAAAIDRLKKEFWNYLRNNVVHRATYNVQVTNSSGNFLMEDKNCQSCFFLEKSENCRYCIRGFTTKDCIDLIGSVAEKCGLGSLDQWGYENICNLYTTYCRYSAYLDSCDECEYCFGCVGLRKKKYCILNRQYSKEEYEELLAKIKSDMKKSGEWGKFFPLSSAYAGYNDSLAQIMFPMKKDEALAFGAKWEVAQEPHYENIINADDLPDTIDEVGDEITKQRILCPETKLSYNVTQQELSFYLEKGIPLPRRHFDWRTLERFKPFSLMIKPQKGTCYYCKTEIEHYYAPELGYQKIACVECYQKEIA